MIMLEQIEEKVKKSKTFPKQNFPEPCGRNDFYRETIKKCKKEGLFLEFGVFQGGTINFISTLIDENIIYGFDSFEGLPEDWSNIVGKGYFNLEGKLPSVNENVSLIKGWFNETLPNFLAGNKENVSLLHLDCDLYSSVSYCLSQLKDRIVPGTVIIFDDFLNFPNYKEHSIKAFCEFLNETSLNFEPIGYVKDEEFSRASIRIIK